ALGDQDRRRDAERRRRVRDALRVVAGGVRDDAAPALRLRQRRQEVRRAAHLERAGELEGLRLHPHLAPARLGQRQRQQGGAPHAAVQPCDGRADVYLVHAPLLPPRAPPRTRRLAHRGKGAGESYAAAPVAPSAQEGRELGGRGVGGDRAAARRRQRRVGAGALQRGPGGGLVV